MKKILLFLTLAIFLSGSGMAVSQVNMTVGESATYPLTITNPLSLEDTVLLDIGTTQNINAWVIGHEGKDRLNITMPAAEDPAGINRTVHLKVLAAKCTDPAGCWYEKMNFIAESSYTSKETTKTVRVRVKPPKGEGTFGSAPGIDFLGILFLGVVGSLFIAFRYRRKES